MLHGFRYFVQLDMDEETSRVRYFVKKRVEVATWQYTTP